MKKNFILFFSLIFLLFPALFSISFPLSAKEKLLLWEAHHPEKAGKLFLAGSVHLGKKDLFPLDRRYDEVLAKSNEIVFEVYEEDESKKQELILEFIRKKAFYPPEKNLKQVMEEKDLLLLDNFYKGRGNMLFMQNGISRRPWLLVLELTMITAQDLGLLGQYGFEEVFKKACKNMPARSLEKAYSQLSMLEGTDEKELCRIIINGVKDFSMQKKELENVILSFRTGDLTPLIQQEEKTAKKYPRFHKRLLLARNYDMTEKLAEYAGEKKSFFVLIGAMHFAGKGSILKLLEGKGFRIKQLEKTGEKGKITGEENDE